MKSGFKKFLLIYVIAWVVLIGAGLFYVWNLLIDYEASLPDVNMQKFISTFDAEHIRETYEASPIELNEYDDKDAAREWYCKTAFENVISFQKKQGVYTNSEPVYEILSGDTVMATAKLVENGKNGHGFSNWEIGDVEFNKEALAYRDYSIKVPAGAAVNVNGNPISDEYLVEEVTAELCKNIADYVEVVPTYKVYKLEHLASKPDIVISGDNLVENDDEYDYSYDFGTDEELMNAVSGRITAMTHQFGAYIINKGDIGALKSYMVGTARTYVSDIPAVWAYLYGQEYSYNFTDESIENFVKYSDDCFSCDANYTLNVHYGKSISYKTKLICTYVKQNGAWYLADFRMENEEEKN